MLIDMIHDNHGELPLKTRYRDPAVLARYGYQAIVIPEALTAIPAAHEDSPAKNKPQQPSLQPVKPRDLEELIDAQVQAAAVAKMDVFFYGDAILLPRRIVMKKPADFLCDDPSGNLCPGKPAVYAALQDQVGELFDRWPTAAGLVMRTGEVYPEATPHMLGSPLAAGNCPNCRGVLLLERLFTFITAMHQAVVCDAGRIYIHRAWQPRAHSHLALSKGATSANIHDEADAYRALSARLPNSADLRFSFKFTRGDFQLGEPFNPCLLADDRPKWIEFQCEREFEGKGAFPNYQAAEWQKFLEHLAAGASPMTPEQMHQRFSLWGWSRGGGWGGPYVQREEWVDANVHALGRLFSDAAAPLADIATAWAALTFQIAESSPPAPAIAELLQLSAPTLQKLLHDPANRASAKIPWVRDDLLDVSAIWDSAGTFVASGADVEVACQQKVEALAGVDRMRHLFDLAAADLPNKSQARDLANTLAYFSSFAETVAHLFCGFARFAQWTAGGRKDADLSRLAAGELEHAQADWQQHTQRHALLPGVPSIFRENTFWQHTHECLEQLAAAPPL